MSSNKKKHANYFDKLIVSMAAFMLLAITPPSVAWVDPPGTPLVRVQPTDATLEVPAVSTSSVILPLVPIDIALSMDIPVSGRRVAETGRIRD